MRPLVIALILVLVTAACGGGDADTTEPSQFPTGSVRSWLDALHANDTGGALELTYEPSMLVVLAAENAMTADEAAPLWRRGATPESSQRYLGSFAQALQERYGSDLAGITVDGFTQLGETYAAVTVTGVGTASIVARRAPGGLWQIDLVATVGPALISQIRMLLEDLEDGPNADTIREVFQSDVLPALRAAALNEPENLGLAAEIRLMESEIGE